MGCFGHGLSYASFKYESLSVSLTSGQAIISFKLQNIGQVDGYSVPQLYLGYPTGAGEPPKVLRSFQQVKLIAGESKSVRFVLSNEDMSIWDVGKHAWTKPRGEFTAMVCTSSCDCRLNKTFSPSEFETVLL